MSWGLVRWGGLAAMAAGVVLVVAFLLTEHVAEGFFWLFGLFMLLLAVALPGLHVRQAGRSGRLGLVGFVAAMVGAIIFVLLFAVVGLAEVLFGFDPDESVAVGVVLLIGFLVVLGGLVLFGITTARAGVFARWAGVLLALGLPLAFVIDVLTGGFTGEESASLGPYIGFPIFAAGLIWLGYKLHSGRDTEQSSRVR